MNKKSNLSLLLVISLLMMTACGNTDSNNSNETTISEAVSEVTESTNDVAEGAETVPNGLVIPEDMTPVYADSLKDGEYNIKVDSSSSMFTVTDCVLTVSEGKMTARMTMGGTGYLYVFMGKGENASEDGYISFEENSDGTHSFTVPVEGLDMGIDCAAFSKKKEMWYDRTLLFRADSLPADAFADGVINTIESLGLADGEYTVDVSLEGGSGRAKINSPARLTIENGEAFAEIVWGSSNMTSWTMEESMTIKSRGFTLCCSPSIVTTALPFRINKSSISRCQ